MKSGTKACAIFWAAVFLAGCSKAQTAEEPFRQELVLGTVCSVTLYDAGKPAVYRDIFKRLREIEERMSAALPDSDLARVNAAAGKEAVTVHPDVFEVIQRALYYAGLSGGAFDPTVGPLVALWGIGGEHPRLPSPAEIDAALPLIDWRQVELDRKDRRVFLKRPGMALDLGAIAKGYAADEVLKIIKKAKVPRGIIDLGGNILVYGEKKDKSPWRVGIQNPLTGRGEYIGIMEIRDKTMVTSGVYERFFEAGGKRYHHILSPILGYPVQNGLLSVTIVTGRSIDADGLSTSVFALGYEKGKALVESLEDVTAVFVFEDRSVRLCGGGGFRLTDDAWRVLPED